MQSPCLKSKHILKKLGNSLDHHQFGYYLMVQQMNFEMWGQLLSDQVQLAGGPLYRRVLRKEVKILLMQKHNDEESEK